LIKSESCDLAFYGGERLGVPRLVKTADGPEPSRYVRGQLRNIGYLIDLRISAQVFDCIVAPRVFDISQ
jgi:hypothetical protein